MKTRLKDIKLLKSVVKDKKLAVKEILELVKKIQQLNLMNWLTCR